MTEQEYFEPKEIFEPENVETPEEKEERFWQEADEQHERQYE